MAVLWKVLAGLFLTLPPGAYLAGMVVGPPQLAIEPPPAVTSHAKPRPPSSPVPTPPAPSESSSVAAVPPVKVHKAAPTVVASPRTKAAKPRAGRQTTTSPPAQPDEVDQTWPTEWPSTTPADPTPSEAPSSAWTEPPVDPGDPTAQASGVSPPPTPDLGTPQPQTVNDGSTGW